MGAARTMDDFLSDPARAGVVGAGLTAFLAWAGNRLVGKAAIQTAVNAAFKENMEQMRTELRAAISARNQAEEERDAAKVRVRELTLKIEELQATIRAMHAAGFNQPPAPSAH